MYSAPAVSYPVHRSRIQLYAIVGLWLTGLCTLWLWLHGADVAGWRHALTFAILVFTGAVAILSWWHTPVGHLRWDLSAWVWTDAGSVVSGRLVVHLDFQKFLLLKYSDDRGRSRWLWLERQTDPAQWMPLRRALYARPRATGEVASIPVVVGAGLP